MLNVVLEFQRSILARASFLYQTKKALYFFGLICSSRCSSYHLRLVECDFPMVINTNCMKRSQCHKMQQKPKEEHVLQKKYQQFFLPLWLLGNNWLKVAIDSTQIHDNKERRTCLLWGKKYHDCSVWWFEMTNNWTKISEKVLLVVVLVGLPSSYFFQIGGLCMTEQHRVKRMKSKARHSASCCNQDLNLGCTIAYQNCIAIVISACLFCLLPKCAWTSM